MSFIILAGADGLGSFSKLIAKRDHCRPLINQASISEDRNQSFLLFAVFYYSGTDMVGCAKLSSVRMEDLVITPLHKVLFRY